MRALLLASILLAPLVMAEHSASPCATEYETLETPSTTLYLINDDTGVWVYQESNAHADLQQGGAPWYDFGTSPWINECWDREIATGEHIENPDFIIL